MKRLIFVLFLIAGCSSGLITEEEVAVYECTTEASDEASAYSCLTEYFNSEGNENPYSVDKINVCPKQEYGYCVAGEPYRVKGAGVFLEHG